MSVRVLVGDARSVLKTMPDGGVQCVCTSPPYYGLRQYLPEGHSDMELQIGLEQTPEAYVAELVAVFREVKRVLRDDGTCWLNIGDSYSGSPNSGGQNGVRQNGAGNGPSGAAVRISGIPPKGGPGFKPKDLLMIPARVAIALQADGWYLRSDIIWNKPNPMPESVDDRPTQAHEHVFLLTRRDRYYYDADAIAEPAGGDTNPGKSGAYMKGGIHGVKREQSPGAQTSRGRLNQHSNGETRNARNVWTIASQPYAGAHFATMPPELARRCILAGTRRGDVVLDPFGGAGTTGLVADRLGRNAVLIELSAEHAATARERLQEDCPMFSEVAPVAGKPGAAPDLLAALELEAFADGR